MAFLGHQYKHKEKGTYLRANSQDYQNSRKYGNDLVTSDGKERVAM